MKKLLVLIVLMGLFSSFSYARTEGKDKDLNTTVAQVQSTDTPATPIKWLDDNLLSAVSGLVLVVYEFLALKIPTSKTVSIIGNLYKLLTWVVGDKSKKGTNFTIN